MWQIFENIEKSVDEENFEHCYCGVMVATTHWLTFFDTLMNLGLLHKAGDIVNPPDPLTLRV